LRKTRRQKDDGKGQQRDGQSDMKNTRKPEQNMPATGHDKKEHVAYRKQPDGPQQGAKHDTPAKRAQPHHDAALNR
jgi:hypothetical protein